MSLLQRGGRPGLGRALVKEIWKEVANHPQPPTTPPPALQRCSRVSCLPFRCCSQRWDLTDWTGPLDAQEGSLRPLTGHRMERMSRAGGTKAIAFPRLLVLEKTGFSFFLFSLWGKKKYGKLVHKMTVVHYFLDRLSLGKKKLSALYWDHEMNKHPKIFNTPQPPKSQCFV